MITKKINDLLLRLKTDNQNLKDSYLALNCDYMTIRRKFEPLYQLYFKYCSMRSVNPDVCEKMNARREPNLQTVITSLGKLLDKYMGDQNGV